MQVTLTHDRALRFVGTNASALQTVFDTTEAGGGLNSGASPMDILLEAAAACTSMDVVSILQKKRRTLQDFVVVVDAERAPDHPKVFTSINMLFKVASTDATIKDLTSAIELSHDKYCSVSITLARSGCRMTWSLELSNGSTTERAQSEPAQSDPAP